jgi:predicted RNA-binding Zn ribbon-like protein
LAASLRLETNIALTCVYALVEPSFYLTNTDAKCAHQHGDGRVGDVVWHPNEADDKGVMADVHNRDMDTSHIEAILCHIVEAFLVAEAYEDAAPREPYPLNLAQPSIELALQLVNNLRHAHITEQRIVFCTEHNCVWLY